MAARLAALLTWTLLTLAACGGQERALDPACTDSADTIQRALGRAPDAVTLPGGTRLSECVQHARNGADLQSAGLVLTRVADRLADRARQGEQGAALALGYLVGAARRGAARTAGLQAELQRRVERAAAYVSDAGPAIGAALRRGVRAGEASG